MKCVGILFKNTFSFEPQAHKNKTKRHLHRNEGKQRDPHTIKRNERVLFEGEGGDFFPNFQMLLNKYFRSSDNFSSLLNSQKPTLKFIRLQPFAL
jgi:hypothetical protein